MTVECFTSISFSYLNRARVLGKSLRRHHPDWRLTLCITDTVPPAFEFRPGDEPYDDIIFARDLGVEKFESWMFKMNVVEACTAIKGVLLKRLIENGASKVFYLDPDIAVFNSLGPLVTHLDTSAVLLTPHQLEPDVEEQAIIDNEICSLAHGTYNLGFLAVRGDDEGRKFARWWNDRCLDYCFDEKDRGLFVDQKWCDLAPALFDRVQIVRDPGYNVASWNLSNRTLSFSNDGTCLVNGEYPLRFYHFTKLGPVGDTMTRRYAKENLEVYELWAWYRQSVADATDDRIAKGWWHYGTYSNGDTISDAARRLYRHRRDLQDAFPNPFDANGFQAWWRAEHRSGALGAHAAE